MIPQQIMSAFDLLVLVFNISFSCFAIEGDYSGEILYFKFHEHYTEWEKPRHSLLVLKFSFGAGDKRIDSLLKGNRF